MSEITCTERAETVVDEEAEGGDSNKKVAVKKFAYIRNHYVFINIQNFVRIQSWSIQMMGQYQAIAAYHP